MKKTSLYKLLFSLFLIYFSSVSSANVNSVLKDNDKGNDMIAHIINELNKTWSAGQIGSHKYKKFAPHLKKKDKNFLN